MRILVLMPDGPLRAALAAAIDADAVLDLAALSDEIGPALQIAQAQRPDLVVIDIEGGADAAATLRREVECLVVLLAGPVVGPELLAAGAADSFVHRGAPIPTIIEALHSAAASRLEDDEAAPRDADEPPPLVLPLRDPPSDGAEGPVRALPAAPPPQVIEPAEAAASDEAPESPVTEPIPEPGASPPPVLAISLVAYPFREFSALTSFVEVLHGIDGVTSLRLGRFQGGRLHARLEYEGAIPLGQRLEQIDALAVSTEQRGDDLHAVLAG